jgi:hypothetical protein
VSFVHPFGASLNRHVHLHCCVIDGVFEGGPDGQGQSRPAQPLTPEALTAIAAHVLRRVLRWFARSGLLEATDAQDMLGWEHGGISLDATLRIAGGDRAGLERLLRYRARPAFALERLTQVEAGRVVCRLPEPQPDRRTALSLTPLELRDRLAALILPPRRHRHRYRGVLAPHAPLRAAVTAYGRDASATDAPAHATTPDPSAAGARTARYHWAILLARLFATFPLLCPQCGAALRLIAFLTAAEPVARILTRLGEPSEPPPIAPARGPPARDELLEPLPDWDAIVQPAPEFQSDQRISWSAPPRVRYRGHGGARPRLHRSTAPRSPSPRATRPPASRGLPSHPQTARLSHQPACPVS